MYADRGGFTTASETTTKFDSSNTNIGNAKLEDAKPNSRFYKDNLAKSLTHDVKKTEKMVNTVNSPGRLFGQKGFSARQAAAGMFFALSVSGPEHTDIKIHSIQRTMLPSSKLMGRMV